MNSEECKIKTMKDSALPGSNSKAVNMVLAEREAAEYPYKKPTLIAKKVAKKNWSRKKDLLPYPAATEISILLMFIIMAAIGFAYPPALCLQKQKQSQTSKAAGKLISWKDARTCYKNRVYDITDEEIAELAGF